MCPDVVVVSVVHETDGAGRDRRRELGGPKVERERLRGPGRDDRSVENLTDIRLEIGVPARDLQ